MGILSLEVFNGKVECQNQDNILLIFLLSVVNSTIFMSKLLLTFPLNVINAYIIYIHDLLLLTTVNDNSN